MIDDWVRCAGLYISTQASLPQTLARGGSHSSREAIIRRTGAPRMLAAKQKPSGVDELAKGYHWVATIASGEVISQTNPI